MLKRIICIEFEKYSTIDSDLFNKIDNFLSKRKDGSYGKLLFPTANHYNEDIETSYAVNNKLIVALYFDDNSSSILASDFVNFIDEIDPKCSRKYCIPIVSIHFKENNCNENLVNKILDKDELKNRFRFKKFDTNYFNFNLICDVEEFEPLIKLILDELNSDYDYVVEYYF